MKTFLKNILKSVSRNTLSKVGKFQNIHQNEECYIIGGGISLKWFDLKEFSNKISIAVNYLPFHNDFQYLNAKYCVLTEPFWFYPLEKTTQEPVKRIPNYTQLAYRKEIEKQKDKFFFVNLSNYPVIWNRNVFFLYNRIPHCEICIKFFSKGVNPFHGTLRTSVLLAIYMGFKKAYLVGFDYTHTPSRILHWFEKGEGITNDQPDYQKDFFEIAQEFIEIETVTIEGGSDKLKSISYKNLTGLDPVFKENTEILTQAYLEVLDTWPGFTIF